MGAPGGQRGEDLDYYGEFAKFETRMRIRKPYLRWILVLSLFCSVPAAGRSWLGAFFSPKATGLSSLSSIGAGEDAFIQADLLLDMNGVYRAWNESPGLQLRAAAEYVIIRGSFATGTAIRWMAGPGLMFGYVSDVDNVFGFTGCVTAETSLMFDFRRKVGIVFSFAADLGLHYRETEVHPILKSYRNGYFRAYYPEIRLLYNF